MNSKKLMIIVVIMSVVTHIHAADEQKLSEDLLIALRYGAPLTDVQNLVARGANVKELQKYSGLNYSALHYALQPPQNLEDNSLILYLIKCGVDVNGKDRFESTPLHDACSMGALEAVKLLLIAGANTEEKNILKQTPADIAHQKHHQHVVTYLENWKKLSEGQKPHVNTEK